MRHLQIKIYRRNTGHHILSFIHPKTKKRKRKKFPTKKEAKDYREEIEREFQTRGVHAFNDQTVAQLMQLHIEKCPATRVKERMNSFNSFLDNFGAYPVNEVGKNELSLWFEGLRAKHDYSTRTLKHIKSELGHFFNFLVDEDIISSSPLLLVGFGTPSPPKRKRVVLSVDEVHGLLELVKIWDSACLYPFMVALAHTGARRSEIARLKREDVDFSMGLIHLHETKNGEDRSVRMSDELTTMFSIHLVSHTSAFAIPDPTGAKLGDSLIYKCMKKFKKLHPNGKEWTFHSFRHSFAFNYLKSGGQMYQLQAILGHKTINMTIDLYG
ncbi:MAG: hypothetical protein COA94_03675 [Rickettsiales bacterium]|nr:MAG: hypothetical protein COA94_03675 [Rickettsiales bacterium]